jgi:hypothetical protein
MIMCCMLEKLVMEHLRGSSVHFQPIPPDTFGGFSTNSAVTGLKFREIRLCQICPFLPIFPEIQRFFKHLDRGWEKS